MAMLLYTLDYWEVHHSQDLVELEPEKGFGIPLAAIAKFFGASGPEL